MGDSEKKKKKAQKKYITKLSEHENGSRAPVVAINVDPNLFYDIAMIDSLDTYVYGTYRTYTDMN